MGRLEAFTLGEHDSSGELSIPQKLYGREQEEALLLSTFGRTRQGTNELLLLSGHAGIGKSALVNELQKQIVHGGYLAAGKFDYLDLLSAQQSLSEMRLRYIEALVLLHQFKADVERLVGEPISSYACNDVKEAQKDE